MIVNVLKNETKGQRHFSGAAMIASAFGTDVSGRIFGESRVVDTPSSTLYSTYTLLLHPRPGISHRNNCISFVGRDVDTSDLELPAQLALPPRRAEARTRLGLPTPSPTSVRLSVPGAPVYPSRGFPTLPDLTSDGFASIREIYLLRESGKNKFSYMRFLENRFSSGTDFNLASVGTVGRYELQKKFTSDRKRMIVQRCLLKEEKDKPEEDDSDEDAEVGKDAVDGESSEGSFEPDSEDEDKYWPIAVPNYTTFPLYFSVRASTTAFPARDRVVSNGSMKKG